MNDIKISNKIAEGICKGNNYRYLYGGKGEAYTKALVNTLAARYPSTYRPSIKKEALKDADKGYIAIDCSGFVCKVLGIVNLGTSQIRDNAAKVLKVNKTNAKAGMILWKKGHVAYVGEGLKIYEAASTVSDMRISEWKDRASSFTDLIILKGSPLLNKSKSESNINKIVDDVIAGKYGNGAERKKKLTAAGYDYAEIQKLVNEKLK